MATESRMSDLFIPGFSTKELSKFATREDYIRHLTVPEISKHEKSTQTKEENMDEYEEKEVAFDLVAELNARIKAQKYNFMLSTPANLTVKEGGGYKKRSHIGGEEFEFDSVYKGKTGIICVFKPKAVEKYTHMEMSEKQAMTKLTNFKTIMETQIMTGEIAATVKGAAKRAADDKERQKTASCLDRYSDFGSF